jgi:hypothetical protein
LANETAINKRVDCQVCYIIAPRFDVHTKFMPNQ